MELYIIFAIIMGIIISIGVIGISNIIRISKEMEDLEE